MPTRPTLRIGLVGAGFLARTRARCWRRVHGVDVRLSAVAAGSLKSAEQFASALQVERALESDALFESDDIDLIDLCVPNHLHRSFSERGAAAGKHVLCTKPLAAYVGQDLGADAPSKNVAAQDRTTMYRVAVADAHSMVGTARANGVPLHYGENWVYAPSVRRAAELSASANGVLLEMHGWEAHSGSHAAYSREWKCAGGGALIRLAAHPVGAMVWLKREEGLRRSGAPIRVESVTAEVADLTRNKALNKDNTEIAADWGEVENFGCVILNFEDGSRGIAHGSDALLGGMQSRLRLLASDHHLECNLSPNDLLRAYGTSDTVFGDEYLMEKLHGQAGWSSAMPDEDWTSGQQGLCQEVAEAVGENRESKANGELGLEVTRVIYAGYIAAKSGRRVRLDDLDTEA